jgi:hypothetical protein
MAVFENLRSLFGERRPRDTTDEATEIVGRIQRVIPNVPSGALRFWGEWFGRPYDNIHTLLTCEADENTLRLGFDQGETLLVWNPRRLTLDAVAFRIEGADRVRWEWYGSPKTPENLYFEDFMNTGQEISASSNVDWYKPSFHPTAAHPAVEIVTITGV